MSLTDEQPFRRVFLVKQYSSRPREIAHVDRTELEKQTAEFLARGGKIAQIPTGVCKDPLITLTEAQTKAASVETKPWH